MRDTARPVLRARVLVALSGWLLGLALLAAQPAFARDGVTGEPARRAATSVVFLGGYGGDFPSAARDFAALRAELQAHGANLAFVQYSYAGWDAEGCGATQPGYGPEHTAQDIETSKRNLIDTLQALRSTCGADRIAVIGHSLGGLVAFHALSDQLVDGVTDLVTIDSPLGGAPSFTLTSCVEMGLCADGPIAAYLAGLNRAWTQTAADNTARVAMLEAAGTRVSAWGNQSDCLYDLARCLPFGRNLLSRYDSRETQWLGIPRAFRRDYPPSPRLASLLGSHHAVLIAAASDIAADVLS
jgi:pimeloyl-ACP methyl ester carboxylesterase